MDAGEGVVKNCSRLAAWILLSANLFGQTDRRREIQVHYERAQEALRVNQPDVAAQEFREILRLDPNNAPTQANLGMIAFTQTDYAKAARAFRAALKLQASLWNAEAFLGMCELRLGHVDEAKTLLQRSFPRLEDPTLRTQAGTDLMRIYYEASDLDKAVDILRVLEQASPTDPDVLYTTYRTYSDLAARALSTLVHAAPDSGRMHEILAQAAESQDDFTGAISQYRKALEINPRLPGVHFELGRVILTNDQQEPARQRAQKEFEAELALDPSHANSEYYLGEIYWLRSSIDVAFQHYSRALEMRPNYVDAQIAAGKVLTAKGQPEKAISHLLKAVRLDPDNESAHYRLAQAYRKLGRTEDADRERAAFQKLRESQAPVRSLYEQLQRRPGASETIEPNEP